MMALLSDLRISTRPLTALIVLLLPAFLSGCFWVPMSDWQYAVWSDDGEGVAFVQRSFEGQELIGHTNERSHEFEVYTSSFSSPDNVTQLAGPFTGDAAGLYFMGSAGYLVVGRTSRGTSGADDDAGEVDTWNYDLIEVDSAALTPVAATEAVSVLRCEEDGIGYHLDSALDVIPSPDGSALATLVSGLSCDGLTPVQSVTLSFLQAAGLEAIGEPLDIDLSDVLPAGEVSTLARGWLADGSFAIAGWAQEEGWLIEPGGAPVWGALPGEGCLEPPTTSGEFRGDGMRVWIDPDGSLSFATEEEDSIFGCGV
jgi:hypothetical protein